MWFRRKVQSGQKLGRKLGFPTLNFYVGRFGESRAQGVYACEVKIQGRDYRGALFFGPKSNDSALVLEVFVIGLKGNHYGKFVSFQVGRKIREPMHFSSLESLKKQIEQDVKRVAQ